MTYKAVLSTRHIQIRQPISGYSLGWKVISCWRLQFTSGRHSFLSQRTYSSQLSAKNAARRLNTRHFKEPTE